MTFSSELAATSTKIVFDFLIALKLTRLFQHDLEI